MSGPDVNVLVPSPCWHVAVPRVRIVFTNPALSIRLVHVAHGLKYGTPITNIALEETPAPNLICELVLIVLSCADAEASITS